MVIKFATFTVSNISITPADPKLVLSALEDRSLEHHQEYEVMCDYMCDIETAKGLSRFKIIVYNKKVIFFNSYSDKCLFHTWHCHP